MSLRKDSIYGIGKKNRKNSEKGWIFADNGKFMVTISTPQSISRFPSPAVHIFPAVLL